MITKEELDKVNATRKRRNLQPLSQAKIENLVRSSKKKSKVDLIWWLATVGKKITT